LVAAAVAVAGISLLAVGLGQGAVLGVVASLQQDQFLLVAVVPAA